MAPSKKTLSHYPPDFSSTYIAWDIKDEEERILWQSRRYNLGDSFDADLAYRDVNRACKEHGVVLEWGYWIDFDTDN